MDVNNVPIYSATTNMNDHSLNGSATATAYNLQPTVALLQQYQNQLISNNENPRTLYVGNLDPQITEPFIRALFSPFGRIVGLKLMNENPNEHYCFVEFEDPGSAAAAIQTMNKRKCFEREIKVNWASSSSTAGTKPDTSRHFHIFVGDLSPEIETQQLREAFSPFGEISDCRVVRDLNTLKSKGYGFVSFVKKQDAENAITNMNGQWIGHRAIRTNWATRKMPSTIRNDNNVPVGPSFSNRSLNFEEIYNQSSILNCTVYCGGMMNGLSEEIIQKAFGRFGLIQEIRVFKEKGYAFIKFFSHDAATNAIVSMHNQDILGQTVKCSWGKEAIDSTSTASSSATAANIATVASLTQQALSSPSLIYPTPYNQQFSYWYQFNTAQPTHHQAYATTVQAAAGGLQYPYNQYYPTGAQAGSSTSQSSAYSNSSSLGITIGSGWNNNSLSTPSSHLSSSSSAASVPIHQAQSTTIQQPTVMNHHYSMQGYQAQ